MNKSETEYGSIFKFKLKYSVSVSLLNAIIALTQSKAIWIIEIN